MIILRPNKRRRRIVNMPLTPAAEAIIDEAPILIRLRQVLPKVVSGHILG